ncbi:Serine/Threonine kinase domain protein (macronuclear) [Tetrahymena thermophila SB210]|uniref:Serine/Threonine kinase domain protein n=1 Tax=Tetrahymena thermophila (strain SB210) TaxID=312017 RepID=Q24FQ7_TETTS|nr:Serine/Threonine kinase domain protein [Tetrahymena thermophila SB210]EAS06587.2 Serine/Threonine kinase domain protein [Tetrahymena thermophila SB210]|eukprot:XP_001026832.2 Serine/Threonine kinase domain protein [Tetrahymena thermophila SB210]
MNLQKTPERFKQVDNYILNLDKILGQGSFGSVYQAIDMKNGDRQVAVKQISQTSMNKNADKLMQLLKNEIKTMKMIKDKNVVQLLDVRRSSNNIYLIVEYCNGGSLESYLNKNGKRLSETETLRIIREIVSGFKCLYEQKIVHRDLKPANILLHDGIPKIADFGFSKVVEHSMEQADLASLVGSPIYMCPQILNCQTYSSKLDVWSLGIIFYEMLYGKTPWKAKSVFDLANNINNTNLEFPSAPVVSKRTQQLIKNMLQKEEEKRLGWEDLFKIFLSDMEEEEEEVDQFEEENVVLKGSGLKLSHTMEEENLHKKQMGDIETIKKTQELNKNYFKKKKAFNSIHDVELYEAKLQKQTSKNQNAIEQEEQMTGSQKNIVCKSETKSGDISTLQKEASQNNTDQSNIEEINESVRDQYMSKFEQYTQEDQKKKIIQEIGQWVLHRRNKAVFLNAITIKFYDLFDQQIIVMNMQSFYRVMFLLSKYQTMIIYRIQQRLKTKVLEKSKKFTQEQWKVFVKSKERLQLLNFIEKDFEVIKQFFEELMKKAGNYFENLIQSKTIKKEEEEQVKMMQSICNKTLIEKNKFDSIYYQALCEFYTFFKQYCFEQNFLENQDMMAFLMHIHNATNIRSFFKYTREPKFDFMKYYEEVTRAPASLLQRILYKQQIQQSQQ